MDRDLVQVRSRLKPEPLLLGTRARPDARRSDRGGGLTNASGLGGFEEFCKLVLNRPSDAVTLLHWEQLAPAKRH